MAMVVQHFRKIKTAVGLQNVAAHNLRDKVYDADGKLIENPELAGKWLHPENEHLNQHTHKKAKASILERRSERLKLANLSRKPQKNAAHAVEVVYSFSPDFCADWVTNPESKAKVDMYFTGAMVFLRDKFGKDNLLQADVHFDEETPHMHVLLAPICKDAVNQNYYSSSNFLGGRAGLKALQTDFAKEVGAVFGLERGVEGSKARHTDQAEWSRELKAKEKALDRQRAELDKERVELAKREEKVRRQLAEIKAFNKTVYDGMNQHIQDFVTKRGIGTADMVLFWQSVEKTLADFKTIQAQNQEKKQDQTVDQKQSKTHTMGF